MAFSCRIYAQEQVVVMEGSGRLTGPAIIEELERFYAGNDLAPGFKFLCDYRSVTGIAIGLDELKAIARIDDTFSNLAYSKLAIVGLSANIETLARLYIAMRRISGKGRNIRFFQDLADALGWLEIDRVPGG